MKELAAGIGGLGGGTGVVGGGGAGASLFFIASASSFFSSTASLRKARLVRQFVHSTFFGGSGSGFLTPSFASGAFVSFSFSFSFSFVSGNGFIGLKGRASLSASSIGDKTNSMPQSLHFCGSPYFLRSVSEMSFRNTREGRSIST
jgi:hypothetical protein